MEAARALADRVDQATQSGAAAATKPTNREKAALTFRFCTSRRPTEREIDLVVKSFDRQRRRYGGRPGEAAKVLALSADQRDPHLAERAAWALVANSLLNLDETITK